ETDPDYDPRTLAVLKAAAPYRTYLGIPIVRDGIPVGAIGCGRREVKPFTAAQIELVKTFADQAVIAIENVRLFKELETRNRDLTESLEQQTATSEILRVISSSPTDIQPVLNTVAESAARLCESLDAVIWRLDGDRLLPAAHHGAIPLGPIGEFALPLARGTGPGRSVIEGRTVHITDLQSESDEFPEGREFARRFGFRTTLCVPLMREGVAIGSIILRRSEVQPFSERQVALLETFADQAVIAIENVRLFKELEARTGELTRSVEKLTALGEVSQALGSTLDLETVLSTIVARATLLAGMDAGIIYEYDAQREVFEARATERLEDEIVEVLGTAPIRKGEGATGQLAVAPEPVQLTDIRTTEFQSHARSAFLRAGYRALLAVPLVREDHLIGALTVVRKTAGEFSR
ncbi:MAG: GAF domain-containing protein, partial [Burkholderiales bacterium]